MICEYDENVDCNTYKEDNSAIMASKKEKAKTHNSYKKTYQMLEEINNGVKYFGQEKFIKGATTALCICPKCNNTWRVVLKSVRRGLSKSCGCK